MTKVKKQVQYQLDIFILGEKSRESGVQLTAAVHSSEEIA